MQTDLLNPKKRKVRLFEHLISTFLLAGVFGYFLLRSKDQGNIVWFQALAVFALVLLTAWLYAQVTPSALLRGSIFYLACFPHLPANLISMLRNPVPFPQARIAVWYHYYHEVGQYGLLALMLILLCCGLQNKKMRRVDYVLIGVALFFFLLAVLLPNYLLLWEFCSGMMLFLLCMGKWENCLLDSKHYFVWNILFFGALLLRVMWRY